jgi:hypothetical protein
MERLNRGAIFLGKELPLILPHSRRVTLPCRH